MRRQGLNFAIPLIVFCAIWAIPESARWLVSKGRDEKAHRSLNRINASNPEYDPEPEFDLIKKDHMKAEEIRAAGGGWHEIFTSPIERRKLISTFGILAGQQIGQFIPQIQIVTGPCGS